MAELLIFVKNAGKKTPGYGHWMDDLTQQGIDEIIQIKADDFVVHNKPDATQEEREKIQEHQTEKLYRILGARHEIGDVVEVRPDGFYTGAGSGFDRNAFVVLLVTDMTVEDARVYMKKWRRSVTVQRTLNDDVNYEYEYTVTINRLSLTRDDELFDAMKDKLTLIPHFITIKEKSPTHVVFQVLPLTCNAVINGKATPLEIKAAVEERGESIIDGLDRKIKIRRYRLAIENLPTSVQNTLKDVGWVSYTKQQVRNYLIDKVA